MKAYYSIVVLISIATSYTTNETTLFFNMVVLLWNLILVYLISISDKKSIIIAFIIALAVSLIFVLFRTESPYPSTVYLGAYFLETFMHYGLILLTMIEIIYKLKRKIKIEYIYWIVFVSYIVVHILGIITQQYFILNW